jgi:hypothetical protein
MAVGERIAPSLEHKVGAMFVRISLDQIVDFTDFQKMLTVGEILRTPDATASVKGAA